jgi:site-specific DNA-adenine methylase
MQPKKVENILLYYSELMKGKNIEFDCKSFELINPKNNKDVVYIDPPYTNTKALYHGNIHLDGLLSWLDNISCSWFMNINGVNSVDNEEIINIKYTNKLLLKSGNSSFSRMKGNNVEVGEYFYYKMGDSQLEYNIGYL